MSFGHYGDHMVHEPGERVKISPLAGKPAPRTMLVDLVRLEREYYERQPDPGDSTQLVRFGTSGHRGSPLHGSFTEAHILAITQAICDYRRGHGIEGPLYMGKDTHGVSGPAQRTAVEVLAANGVDTIIQRDDGVTPTPVISRAILAYNRGRTAHLADGIVVTPSHNPPEDGGFKYTPPTAAPPRPTSRGGSRIGRTSSCARAMPTSSACHFPWPSRRRRHIRRISSCRTWRTLDM
jgi:alpha-D-glucose phosphate-specific phosphoglucomutase